MTWEKEPDDILLSYQHFHKTGTRDDGWIRSNWPVNEATAITGVLRVTEMRHLSVRALYFYTSIWVCVQMRKDRNLNGMLLEV